MRTGFSEPLPNSASTIVAKPLEPASATWTEGIAYTPGGVVWGGSTLNAVVNDSNGVSSMWAVIRLSPAEQNGPPRTATMAFPSGSSSTEMPLPVSILNGFGSYQVRLPLQRLYSWLAVILIFEPVP